MQGAEAVAGIESVFLCVSLGVLCLLRGKPNTGTAKGPKESQTAPVPGIGNDCLTGPEIVE